MFRYPVLENLHERFLFLNGQPVGRIQNLCKLCHVQNLAPMRPLGNDVLSEIDFVNLASKFFQFFSHQFNQLFERGRIELERAAGGGEQFRQRPRTAQPERPFVIVQRLHLVAF